MFGVHLQATRKIGGVILTVIAKMQIVQVDSACTSHYVSGLYNKDIGLKERFIKGIVNKAIGKCNKASNTKESSRVFNTRSEAQLYWQVQVENGSKRPTDPFIR